MSSLYKDLQNNLREEHLFVFYRQIQLCVQQKPIQIQLFLKEDFGQKQKWPAQRPAIAKE